MKNHDHHTHAKAENMIYVRPMHPEVRQDGPGDCPKCGMRLVPAKRTRITITLLMAITPRVMVHTMWCQPIGITLVKGNLDGIVRPWRLARDTMRNIRQNLLFALIYNASGVPVAAGVLFPFFGILISPMFAALAMSASSISVVLNSLRLRSTKI